jgi:uncharacterized protein (DUF58 family)
VLQLLGVGGVLCLLAGSFAVPALYVPGVAVVIVAVAAPTGVALAAIRTRVTLRPSAESVEEGRTVAVAVRVSGWPPGLFGGELRPSPGAPWGALASRALGASGPARMFALAPPRRGRVRLGPASVRFRDPFGIYSRRVSSPAGELLVLPRIERVAAVQLDRLRGVSPPSSSVAGGMGADGLRPYRPGAAAARIHWLSVARTGALLERRLEDEDEQDAGPLVVLDTRCQEGGEELDMAVRATASLSAGLASRGGCSLLLPGERRPHALGADLAGWAAAHARLALVAEGVAPSWEAAAGERLVVWVGAGAPPEETRLGTADLACTVSPRPSRERPVMFHVAGCAVQPTRRALAARAA